MSGVVKFFSSFAGAVINSVGSKTTTGQRYSDSPPKAPPIVTPERRNQERNQQEGPPQTQTFDEWKQERNQILIDFLVYRSSLNSDHQNRMGQDDKNPKGGKEIPSVDQTSNDAASTSEIDLKTKTLNLSLCKVEAVFPCRSTGRFAGQSARRTVEETDTHRPLQKLPLLPFGKDMQDDGPLSTCYKRVLSMEIVELKRTGNNKDDGGTSKRIAVFFYNNYAELLSKFFQHRSTNRLISLENVPSCCILPHWVEDRSWFDRDRSGFCLCVGDQSEAQLGDTAKIAFQGDNLKIGVAALDQNSEAQEGVLTPECIETMSWNPATNLQVRYRQWQELEDGSTQNSTKISSPVTALEMSKEAKRLLEASDRAERMQISAAKRSAEPDLQHQSNSSKRARRQCRYHKLSELRELLDSFTRIQQDEKQGTPFVNVFGVVLSFGVPKQTRKQTWMVSISLVDQSSAFHQDQSESGQNQMATTINFFRSSEAELPRNIKVGDILKLKGAGLIDFKGGIQLLGRRTTTFQLISKTTDSAEWTISHGGLDKTEMDQVKELWKWGQLRLTLRPTMNRSFSFTLGQADSKEDFQNDTIVLVSALLDTDGSETSVRGYLRVWDGKGTPTSDAVPSDVPCAEDIEECGDPSLSALNSVNAATLAIQSLDKKFKAKPVSKLCGRVANVAILSRHHWNFVKKRLWPGTFVRLRNVTYGQIKSSDPPKIITVRSKSSVVPLPTKVYEIRQMVAEHWERQLLNAQHNPSSAILYKDSLADGSEDQVNRIYYVRFSISKLSSDNTSGSGMLSSFVETDRATGTCRFAFVARLKDETKELSAIISNKIGEAIFGMTALHAQSMNGESGDDVLRQILRDDRLWCGKLQSFKIKEKQFFMLRSIKESSKFQE